MSYAHEMSVNPTFPLIFVTVKMLRPTFDFPTQSCLAPSLNQNVAMANNTICQEVWKSRLRLKKMFIFYEFSIRNSGASSGDVIKIEYTAGETGV